ncbi:hypothetical protein JCGZ_16070 [Jatropha curcas]|uniref:Uncharacterized protein n=1 Tax=Jatropha curcas TaxID=180498 RepID=A0A067L375_JATCU|nr:hypothetical protein JCGZ_16070 [Jatropha curcas]
MHFHQFKQKKIIVLILLYSLLVSGEKEETMAVTHADDKQPRRQEKHQRLRSSFDVLFSSKRKVPNASDPLHNR